MSTQENYQLSDPHNGNESYGNLIAFMTDGDISRSASTARVDNPGANAHCDLISFLAIAQRRKVDYTPITWQPGLDILGMGATAEVRQLPINLQASFAFKRTKVPGFSTQDLETECGLFRALVAEISILGHPSIREHPYIVNLEGIFWEAGEEDGKFWPVLVFEKAQLGDMNQFMESNEGRQLSLTDKLKLCINIGTAIMIMHSCHVIHGDIKPKNILVFKDDTGNIVPRVADFGFSTLIASETEDIFLPKSEPWNAPECHHRGINFSAAKKADAYSFGMLCLWILFEENFSDVVLEFPELSQGIQDFNSFRIALEQLKLKNKVADFAHSLIAISRSLSECQKSNLCKFFSGSLVNDVESRSSSFMWFLQLLDGDSTTLNGTVGFEYHEVEQQLLKFQFMRQIFESLPIYSDSQFPELLKFLQILYQEKVTLPQALGLDQQDTLKMRLPHADFQISRSLFRLCRADYRLRKYIARLLQRQAKSDSCEHCRLNAALQMAFCFKIGFGVRRNEDQALSWLTLSKKKDLNDEMEMSKSPPDIKYGEGNLFNSVGAKGFLDPFIDYGNGYRKSENLEHVEAEYRNEIDDMQESLGKSNRIVGTLKHILAVILMNKGDRQKALDTLEEIRQAIPGDSADASLITTLTNIGVILSQQGKYSQAEKMFNQSREMCEKLLGKDHLRLLYIIDNLGLAFLQQEKYNEAEELYRSLLQKTKGLFETGNLGYLMVSENYATVLLSQGKGSEAEEIMCESLRGWEKALGENDPRTLSSMNLVAGVFSNQGRYEAAENMYRRLLRLSENVLGKNDPKTLKAVGNLSSCLRDKGKYKEAEEMLQRALEGFDDSTEKIPQNIIWGHYNHGLLHGLRGRFEAAEELIQQAADMCENFRGKDHPETLDIRDSLTYILMERGKYEAAEEICRTVLRTKKMRLGKTHPSTLNTVANLASALDSQGKYEIAGKMQRLALESEEKVLEKNHPSILLSCNNLATSLFHQGQYIEAENLFERALDGKEKVYGKHHPSTLNTLDNLGSVRSAQHKYKAAEEMHAHALEGFEKQLGNSHPRTLSSVVNVAGTLMGQRKYRAAKGMLIRALNGREAALGKEHPDTQSCVEQLNSLFRALAMMETTEWGLRQLGQEWKDVLGPWGVAAELSQTPVDNHPTPKSESWLGALVPKGFKNISSKVKISQVDLRGSGSESGSHLFDEPGPVALLKNDVSPIEDHVEHFVVSDFDEQLMIFIPFHCQLKVHSIHITSVLPPNNDDESLVRPTSIRLFKNTPNILDFSEANELPDTQQFRIGKKSWDKETSTTVLDLNFVKFQNVVSLVIFVNGLSLEENIEDGVFTRIDRIRIFGK